MGPKIQQRDFPQRSDRLIWLNTWISKDNKMKNTLKISILLLLLNFYKAAAQDPKLPPTNLGIINMQDGNPPPLTGWVLQQFVQSYQSGSTRNAYGESISGPKMSSLLSMTQLIYVSKIKVLGGNLDFTALLPVIRISANGNGGNVPSINSGSFGDIITGSAIQWFNKQLFGMRFSHRLEADVVLPTGSFNERYDINPSAHLYSTVLHYAFTLFLTDKAAISMRHMLTYNFNEIGTQVKPGMFYNFNYALEYPVAKRLRAEVAGYYLTQINQDSYNGNDNYYQQTFGIPDTRERVLAVGPGLSYITPSGLFIELKGMQETAAKNRTQGFRTALSLSYMLDKH